MMSLENFDVSPSLIRCKVDESSTTDDPALKPHATTKQNVVPRYLRASTGSCHDACKHGKPHEFKDSRPWKPKRRVSAPQSNNKNNVDIQIFVDKKVKNAVKPSSANGIEKDFPSHKRIPLVDSLKNVKQEGRSSRKWSSYEAPKMTKKVVPSPDTLKAIRKSDQNKNTQEGRSSTKLSSNEAPKMVKKVVQSPDIFNAHTQEAISARKRDNSVKRASSNAKERNACVRPLKQDVTSMDLSSSPNLKKSGEKRMNEPKTANARVSRVTAKKIQTPSTVTSSLRGMSRVGTNPSPDLRTTSSNMKKTKSPENNSQVIQAVIETPNETQLIQSLTPSHGESPNSSFQTYSTSFTSHGIDSECEDSVSSSDASGKMDDLNNLDGPTHGDNTLASEDDEDPKPMNMKFRRGKVTEPQSESKSETKAKFKQGRAIESKQEVNVGSRRKSCRKRATDNHKKKSEAAAVKVVLRHQDVEVKKEEQFLLNNVIEQTANKLVETRKSKVKALVGAFETVISLQERKSSSADR